MNSSVNPRHKFKCNIKKLNSRSVAMTDQGGSSGEESTTSEIPVINVPDRPIRARSKSPRRAEHVKSRAKMQMQRLAALRDVDDEIKDSSDTLRLCEVDQLLKQVDEIDNGFRAGNSYITQHWPVSEQNEGYMADDFFILEASLLRKVSRALSRLKASLTPPAIPPVAPVGFQSRKSQVSLPNLTLPTFDGLYESRPQFYAQFKSAMERVDVDESSKLTYSKGQLSLAPLSVMNSMKADMVIYKSSMRLLKERFGNAIKAIGCQLNNIFELPRLIHRLSKSLFNISSTFNQTLRPLRTQKMLLVVIVSWSIIL